jgi:hypothetical protein
MPASDIRFPPLPRHPALPLLTIAAPHDADLGNTSVPKLSASALAGRA